MAGLVKRVAVISVLAMAVFLACAGSVLPVSQDAEDIKPYYPEGWSEDEYYPEELIPLEKKRNLLTLMEEKKKKKKVPVIEKEISLATATGTQEVPDVATSAVKTGAEGTVVVAGAQAQPEKPEKDPLLEETVRKKKKRGPISGSVKLKVQTANASGDEVGFLSRNGLLFFNDKIQQSTRINVDKKYDNGLMVEGRFIDEPYRDQHLHFNVRGRRGHAFVGDIQTRFRGGEMVSFTKKARGLDVEYDFGPVSMFAMMSSEKSRTERVTFRGRNMRGPYVFRATSLLENSEAVFINGKPVSKADYNIDYFLGQITFTRNIDSSDLVEITYESVLQVSLKTGSLHGLGLYTDRRHKTYDLGMSYLEEGTSRISDPTVYNAPVQVFEEVVANSTYALNHNYIKTDSEVVTLTVGVETDYLDRDTDYTIDYYDPEDLRGSITLSEDLFEGKELATGSLVVDYSYYNTKYLQRVEDGFDIFDYEDSEYLLTYERIYPGPEVVYYVDDTRRIQLYPYGEPGEVNSYYEIDETNNIIVFHWDETIPDYTENPYVEISYEIVPANTPGESDVKRTVWDMTGRVTLGDANFRAEYSETSSDIAMKTIHVTEERVGIVTISDAGQIYPLQFPAIPNTESVYFNDTLSSKSRKRPGSDYVLEYNENGSAFLRFKNEIPPGTTIIASYTYNPIVTAGSVRTGKAGRFLADWDIYGGSIGFEYMLKNAFFSPLTSYSDEERERIGLNLKYAPGQKWDSEFRYRSRTDHADLSSGILFTTKEFGTTLKYKYRPKSHVAYTYERLTYRDSRANKLTDLGRDRHRLEGRYAYREGNTVVTDFHVETRDTADATGRTSDHDAMKYGVDVRYRPDDKLSVILSTNSNDEEFDAPDEIDGVAIPQEYGDFKTNTVSNVLDVTYLPAPIWTLNARLDTQEIQDDREDAGSDSVHKIHASIFSKPVNRVKKVYLGFDRRDRPNPYYGDTRTESTNAKIAYSITPKWTMTPGYTYSKSLIQDKSRSNNSNIGLLMDYRSGEKSGWLGSFQHTINTRKNSRLTSTETGWTSSTSDQNKTTVTTRYISGKKYEWKNSATYSENSSSANSKRGSLTTILDYKYSLSTRMNMLYNVEAITRRSGDRTKLQLGSSTEIGENFTLGLSLKQEKSMGTSSRAYTGTLFNMTLDMRF